MIFNAANFFLKKKHKKVVLFRTLRTFTLEMSCFWTHTRQYCGVMFSTMVIILNNHGIIITLPCVMSCASTTLRAPRTSRTQLWLVRRSEVRHGITTCPRSFETVWCAQSVFTAYFDVFVCWAQRAGDCRGRDICQRQGPHSRTGSSTICY